MSKFILIICLLLVGSEASGGKKLSDLSPIQETSGEVLLDKRAFDLPYRTERDSSDYLSYTNVFDYVVATYPDADISLLDENYLLPHLDHNQVLLLTKGDQQSLLYLYTVEADDRVKIAPDFHQYYPDTVLLTIQPGFNKSIVKELKSLVGMDFLSLETLSGGDIYQVEIDFKVDVTNKNSSYPKDILASFSSLKSVQHVEFNHVKTLQIDDNTQYQLELGPAQWALDNKGPQVLGGAVFDQDADGAAAMSYVERGLFVKYNSIVAVIDSGSAMNHQALKDALWINKKEIPNNGIDDDQNGYVDDIHGWNVLNNNNNINDYNGHGSFITGIIAARPYPPLNFHGISKRTKVITVKLTNSGEFSSSSVIKSIDYLLSLDIPIRAVNMSFGSFVFSRAEMTAVDKLFGKDIVSVSAAGNDGVDVSKTPYYPCQFNFQLCVGATNRQGDASTFSNYSTNHSTINTVRVSAPGEAVYSVRYTGGFHFGNGTSYAAPHVTGALALNATLHPQKTRLRAYADIIQGASQDQDLENKFLNGNKLNIYNSLFKPKYHTQKDQYCYQKGPGHNIQRNINFPFANIGEPGIDGSSPEKAFTICNAAQLQQMNNRFRMNDHFALKANISFRYVKNFFSIGSDGGPFNGSLNGNGYQIRNLNLTKGHNFVGLFRELGPNAKVEWLRMSDFKVKGKNTIGAIAAKSQGLINQVQVEGVVEGTQLVGGIVGKLDGGSIANSFFEGIVTGNYHAGGIVGYAHQGAILNRVFAAVELRSNGAGGIAGRLEWNSQVINSHAYVTSTGHSQIGGLVSELYCRAVVRDSYAAGDIQQGKRGAGAVSILSDANIENIYSSVRVTGAESAGMLVERRDKLLVGIGGGSRRYFCSTDMTPPPDSVIRGAYYLDTNKQGAGGSPRSRQQLISQHTFRGWDFNTRWAIRPGLMPALRHLPRSDDGL